MTENEEQLKKAAEKYRDMQRKLKARQLSNGDVEAIAKLAQSWVDALPEEAQNTSYVYGKNSVILKNLPQRIRRDAELRRVFLDDLGGD